MVRIPYIKIPSVRVGSIVPTSNSGTGGATPAPPTPITYLTNWKIVGNSEVHDNEIWSCGEYNATDGKYHILVKPLGGSIVDIALDEPLRKVNDVADKIEFNNGSAVVTRYFKEYIIPGREINSSSLGYTAYAHYPSFTDTLNKALCMCAGYTYTQNSITQMPELSVCIYYQYNSTTKYRIVWRDNRTLEEIREFLNGKSFIYELDTPTTELVDAPQIEEAESYTCVISQGAKAVSWSSFETDSE